MTSLIDNYIFHINTRGFEHAVFEVLTTLLAYINKEYQNYKSSKEVGSTNLMLKNARIFRCENI